jgi:hypothetical protein
MCTASTRLPPMYGKRPTPVPGVPRLRPTGPYIEVTNAALFENGRLLAASGTTLEFVPTARGGHAIQEDTVRIVTEDGSGDLEGVLKSLQVYIQLDPTQTGSRKQNKAKLHFICECPEGQHQQPTVWACEACTFENPLVCRSCEVCGTCAPPPAPAAACPAAAAGAARAARARTFEVGFLSADDCFGSDVNGPSVDDVWAAMHRGDGDSCSGGGGSGSGRVHRVTAMPQAERANVPHPDDVSIAAAPPPTTTPPPPPPAALAPAPAPAEAQAVAQAVAAQATAAPVTGPVGAEAGMGTGAGVGVGGAQASQSACWGCGACTFRNEPAAVTCAMCARRRD